MSNLSQDYEITIGIECHVQLATKTKLFSPADNDARDQNPNTCVSPIDYALPGMLPLLNAAAVKLAVRAGHAMNCEIHPTSHFDRKHYFYPDLPKGYQISQFFQPLIGAGHISLPDGSRVRIEHAHLEEDAGKLTHYGAYSLVDLNRAGTPLLEIVSQPDIHSARQAAAYCKELWRIMTTLASLSATSIKAICALISIFQLLKPAPRLLARAPKLRISTPSAQSGAP